MGLKKEISSFFIFCIGVSLVFIFIIGIARLVIPEDKAPCSDSLVYKTSSSVIMTFKEFLPVRITSYNPEPSQTDFYPFTTADGSKITDDTRNWCAVSRDLLHNYFDFVDTLVIMVYDDGLGCPMCFKVVIHDITNARLTNTVDLLFLDPKLNFTGRGDIVEVHKSTKNYIIQCK